MALVISRLWTGEPPRPHRYDGHTLEAVIPETETQIGASLSRVLADRG